MPPALLLLVQIAVILALSRLATPIAGRLGQPPVIAEMVAGLMLGPSLLGWIAPHVSGLLFPPASLPALIALGQFGVALFMFLVGWRLEIETLKTVGRMALVTSIVSIALPFALGSAVAVVAWYPYAPQGVTVAVRALHGIGDEHHRVSGPGADPRGPGADAYRIGVLAMTCAAFDDAVGWRSWRRSR